ncbi:MAG: NAD(P)-dependent oxidoreductase [Candidatus Obscuribacterales bacterium]|nr:NAD(P)-dependent oxidoreductase [Candidatus Obscuribacterales bacterium]
MRVLLTGGAGDLGQFLCRSLTGMGHTPVVFDVRKTGEASDTAAMRALGVPSIEFIEGSVLHREQLNTVLKDIDVVVHLAAWHGIHEARKERDVYEFWDLNVGGTFNVFQAAAENGIKNIVFVSSTSVSERFGIYGHTKVLGEEIANVYAFRHGMNVIILRPRAFIPPWNQEVYSNFIEWARWFAQGGVHISDVAQSVVKSIELLVSTADGFEEPAPLCLPVDGAYEYSDEDLANWDAEGRGSTFRKRYAQFYDLALEMGLNPALKPTKLDISKTTKVLRYRPLYSMKTLLMELRQYGASGPYADRKP